MDYYNKIKLWFYKTGLSNIGYLIAFVISFIFGSKFLAGSMLGIFIYINYNVIQKIVKDKLHKLS